MHKEDQQFLMPDLLDTPAMIKKYQDNNTPEARALLDDERVKGSWDQVLAVGEVLVSFLTLDESQVRPADFDMDGGWGGLDETLGGIERLYTRRGPTPLLEAEQKAQERATLLREHWIGGGLKFLLLTYADEWRESDFRIRRLNEPMGEGLETPRQALEGLGLGMALERVVRLHQTYGMVLKLGAEHQEVATKIAAFEAALDHFLAGVRFHYKGNKKAHTLFLLPYEEAIEAGRSRRRKASAQRKARQQQAAE